MSVIREYVRASSIEDVVAALRGASLPAQVLAGGTDLLTKLGRGSPEPVVTVDICAVHELTQIETTADGLRIGAATKLADIERSNALTGVWRVLAEGAAKVGSSQVRNLATLGGNICNASPAADTIPPLLVLEAQVETVSPRGRRMMRLVDFFAGPGRTVLEKDEMLAFLHIPRPPDGASATYLKHSPRRAMDLAVVGVAVLLVPSNGRLEARIALGAVSPTPMRASAAEQLLATSARMSDEVIAHAARLAAEAAAPISDIRASAPYRREMVRVLTERALQQARTAQT
jgi:CO/xanthine dehydrogenase FAD-binding subunit